MVKRAGWILTGLVILAAMAASADAETEPPRVVATYFHRTVRCQTCLQIESLARYDVTYVMVSDIERGLLEWRSLNFEEEQNAHFEKEYGLDGPTLVITIEDGDKVIMSARLDKVWDIYDNVEVFDEYVLGTVEEYLTAASKIELDRAQSR